MTGFCLLFTLLVISPQIALPTTRPSADFISEIVFSVIPGAMSKNEQMVNIAAMSEKIPPEFWLELKKQGLSREDSPVPVQNC